MSLEHEVGQNVLGRPPLPENRSTYWRQGRQPASPPWQATLPPGVEPEWVARIDALEAELAGLMARAGEAPEPAYA